MIASRIVRLCTLALLLLMARVGVAAEPQRGVHRVPVKAVAQDGANLELYTESHALLIGSSRYRTWASLPTIPSELDELDAALSEQGFAVQRLVDPEALELKAGIQGFIDEHGYESGNRLLIFFSGHGHSIGDRGFLLPVDAPFPDEPGFRRHALPMTQVMAWARDIEAKHVLFLFDSCFAGTVFKSRNLPGQAERYIRRATAEPVRQFITAGGADQVVPAKSTFTPALSAAIRGEGDLNEDGYVTGSELGVHLSQLVPRFVDQTPQYGKIREYDLSRGDFVFLPVAAPAVDPTEAVAHEGSEGPLSITRPDLEALLWSTAERDGSPVSLRAYLERYPDGAFAAIARDRLRRLEARAPDPEAASAARAALEAAAATADDFDLVRSAADLAAVQAILCSRGEVPESDASGRLKREASAVYLGEYAHRGQRDLRKGWGLYLDAIEQCSTSALVDIATALLRKKQCDIALGYARLAAENGHAAAPRLVSQIERKPARACNA